MLIFTCLIIFSTARFASTLLSAPLTLTSLPISLLRTGFLFKFSSAIFQHIRNFSPTIIYFKAIKNCTRSFVRPIISFE